MKRWIATAYFEGREPEEYQFNEFVDLADWMESGPHWGRLDRIEIRYQGPKVSAEGPSVRPGSAG